MTSQSPSLLEGSEELKRKQSQSLPIACSLEANDFKDRMDSVRQFSEGVLARKEFADGYEWTFPGDEQWYRKLADFVWLERQCCQFLQLGLTLEPGKGPIKLSLRGGPDVKRFLERIMSAHD